MATHHILGAAPSSTKPSNYAALHARPLPLAVYPLPPLIPHNPLSLLHIAVSWLAQVLSPPNSHPTKLYCGHFDACTRSVHVTEASEVRALWEQGFFGKGNLSRSEPTWWLRELRRLGLAAGETAEEVTARRRAERKAFKQERARKERELIDAQHRGSSQQASAETAPATQKLNENTSSPSAADYSKDPLPVETAKPTNGPAIDPAALINQEHLQLELVEAFFLAYALGVLAVYSPDTQQPIPNDALLHLCIRHSTFPPLASPLLPPQPAPDNPFLLAYTVYHHFRSLGWVVRNGVKFGVDWLLYLRGPVFSHAEFAVLVVPAYTHPYWRSEEAARAYRGISPRKPWHWLHRLNRVQAQVRKSLVLCYVEVPPPHGPELHGPVDIGRLFRRYQVREILVKRWVPNRSRD